MKEKGNEVKAFHKCWSERRHLTCCNLDNRVGRVSHSITAICRRDFDRHGNRFSIMMSRIMVYRWHASLISRPDENISLHPLCWTRISYGVVQETYGQNNEGRACNSEAIIGTRFISTRVLTGLKLPSFGILSTDFRRVSRKSRSTFSLIATLIYRKFLPSRLSTIQIPWN